MTHARFQFDGDRVSEMLKHHKQSRLKAIEAVEFSDFKVQVVRKAREAAVSDRIKRHKEKHLSSAVAAREAREKREGQGVVLQNDLQKRLHISDGDANHDPKLMHARRARPHCLPPLLMHQPLDQCVHFSSCMHAWKPISPRSHAPVYKAGSLIGLMRRTVAQHLSNDMGDDAPNRNEFA